jgi:hypothetical protein
MNKKTITVEFVDRKNHPFPIVGWLIKLIEGTPFSHVAIRVDAGNNREFVYHSTIAGVNFMSKKLYRQNYEVIRRYTFDMTKEQQKKLVTWFLDHAGEKYPVKEIIGVMIVL